MVFTLAPPPRRRVPVVSGRIRADNGSMSDHPGGLGDSASCDSRRWGSVGAGAGSASRSGAAADALSDRPGAFPDWLLGALHGTLPGARHARKLQRQHHVRRARDAIGIFQLALETSPNDPNLLDSLGEGYVAAGDRARSVPLAKWLSQSTAFAGSKPDRLVRRQANS